MAEAERVGRRGRGGGGAARRAERSAVRFDTARFIERNVPNLEVLNEEALQIIERNAETVLEEIGAAFVENPAALQRWRDAGADVSGERVRIPRGLARKLCETAPGRFTQIARNPRAQRGDRGQLPRPRPGLRAALLARPRGRAALCHDGRFRDAGEAGLHVRMAAPFGRHCLRTDGRAGQQAPFRHALRPYAAFGQTLHGFGYRTLPRRRFHRDGQDPLSARTLSTRIA